MSHYALKTLRVGERARWVTGLTLVEALEYATRSVIAEEEKLSPRYFTATIYRDAKVVSLFRYFPPGMRRGESAAPPLPEDKGS